MRAGGFLFVEATPVDWNFRLPSDRYLTVTVTSSSGEFEEMRLRRAICGLESGQSYACRFFSVSMGSGGDVRLLQEPLAQKGARFSLIANPPTYASAYAFRDWQATMRYARSLPGVQYVELVHIFALANGGQIPFAALLAGALPFESERPIANDGVVSAQPTDSVWIRYTQPAGNVETFAVVPPGPPL